jgi:hypothetical protein
MDSRHRDCDACDMKSFMDMSNSNFVSLTARWREHSDKRQSNSISSNKKVKMLKTATVTVTSVPNIWIGTQAIYSFKSHDADSNIVG